MVGKETCQKILCSMLFIHVPYIVIMIHNSVLICTIFHNFADRPVTTKQTCESSYYKCCPDGVSFARGPNYEGCPQKESRPGRIIHLCVSDWLTVQPGHNSRGILTVSVECMVRKLSENNMFSTKQPKLKLISFH